MISATQRTACDSISLATCDRSHLAKFVLIAAASRSASAPIGAADEVM